MFLAKKALVECRFPFIRGVQCRVLPYAFKQAKVQSKTADGSSTGDSYVFVKGFMKAKWMHSDLYKAFETYGKILSAKVSMDRTHTSRGYGYL